MSDLQVIIVFLAVVTITYLIYDIFTGGRNG